MPHSLAPEILAAIRDTWTRVLVSDYLIRHTADARSVLYNGGVALDVNMAKRLQRAIKRKRLTSRKQIETVVTSLVLPRSLHELATMTAYRLNWSLAEVVRSAVEEWLDRHGKSVGSEHLQ